MYSFFGKLVYQEGSYMPRNGFVTDVTSGYILTFTCIKKYICTLSVFTSWRVDFKRGNKTMLLVTHCFKIYKHTNEK